MNSSRKDELFEVAKQLQVPYELVEYVHDHKKLPVVNFAAGGVATPADAALMMQRWGRRSLCWFRNTLNQEYLKNVQKQLLK